MAITVVVHTPGAEHEYSFDPAANPTKAYTIADVKSLMVKDGLSPETSSLCIRQGEKLADQADDVTLTTIATSERVDLELRLLNVSGGGNVCDISTKQFECMFRCMCCFSGIDGNWNKCQYCCLHCQCSIM